MKYYTEIEENDVQNCFKQIDNITDLILNSHNEYVTNYLLDCLTKCYEYLGNIYLGKE